MRVAIFTDNDFQKVNGVTTTLAAVLKHAPASVSLKVYTADSTGTERPDYVALKSVGVPIPFYGEMQMYLPRVAEYARRLAAEKVDVIHLTTPGPMGLVAMRMARSLALPMVGTFHTDLAAYTHILSGSRALGALMREYMRWPYGRCDRVLVPSESTRTLLLGAKGRPERIGIWTRGVDTDAFSPVHRSEHLRRSWRVSSERPAILYVGRISREKGLDLLPVLERRLREVGIPHRFILVGHGPMLQELRETLDDAVFTGSLDRQAVAAAFAAADIFLFPSRTDTAGNVVLEAQASGVPVLVSDAGGPRENMRPGVTGAVVSGIDPDGWVDALARLLCDQALRVRMGQHAREYACGRRWDTALQPLYRTYQDVLVARRRGVTPMIGMAGEPVA